MALHAKTLKQLPRVTGCYGAFLTSRALSLSSYDSQKEIITGSALQTFEATF